MADAPEHDARCLNCQTRYQPGQERCTACGAALIAPARPSRRGPIGVVAAVVVIAAGAVAVAQASATDNAQRTVAVAVVRSTTPQDPVPATSAPLPPATKPTSSPPKAVPVASSPTSGITIPGTSAPLIAQQQAAAKAEAKLRAEAKKQQEAAAKATNPTTPATTATTPKSGGTTATSPITFDDKKKLRVTKVIQYNPNNRVGAVFGDASAAIDDNVRTVWDVTVPVDHQPVGVGLVLDLGQTKRVSSLKLGTPTPGFGAVVYYADASSLPPQLDNSWTRAKKIKSVNNGMEVQIADTPQWARYVLVWFTNPSDPANPRVAISELELLP